MIVSDVRANLAVVQQGIALLATLDPFGYATRDPAVLTRPSAATFATS